MASILAKGPHLLASLFGVRPTPGSGSPTPAAQGRSRPSNSHNSQEEASALEFHPPEQLSAVHQEPFRHRDVEKETVELDQPADSTSQMPSSDETDSATQKINGFSSSGKYSLIRDVIIRAEFISDKQTKVEQDQIVL